jgi:short-subunit dehydrogenase
MKVSDKTIVITGAGSGLGRELTLLLISKYAKIIALDINEEALAQTVKLAKDAGDKIQTHTIDITDKQGVEELAKKIINESGNIDGLINNAGIIQPFLRVNDLDYESIDRVMKVNVYGALYLTKSFLPHLLKRPVAHIVNVSSMGGFLPVPGQSVYGASKAAIKLMTEGLYAELLDTNVRVTVVLPGAMETNISVNSGVTQMMDASSDEAQSFKALSPITAAQVVVRGIEKDAFRILVGSDAKFMDFIYRLNPKYATRYISKKMKSLLAKQS